MHDKCAQQPRDIVVIDEEDAVEAVQPSQYHLDSVLRFTALPHRDAHGQHTLYQAPQRETTSTLTPHNLKRLSSTLQKSVVSDSTERSPCPTVGAVYHTTGRRQPGITQDEPSWRLDSNNTHLTLCIPTSPEEEVRATQHGPEALGTDPLSHVTHKGSKNIVTIDLDTDDDSEFSAGLTDVIEDDFLEQKRSPTPVLSLESLDTMYETLERISSDNRTLKAGKTVELSDGEFLRIQSVVRDITTTEIFLQGHRLRRARDMHGLLELKLNEVVMILQVEETDPRPVMVQGIEHIPLAQVGRIRELVVTNKPFPELSFRELAHESRADEIIANYGRLVCRWKYTVSFRTPRDKQWNKYPEKCLTRFQESEIDSCFVVSDEILRRDWRGDTVKGGASLDMPAEEEDFDTKERVASRVSESIRPPVSHHSSRATVYAQRTGSKSSKTSTESGHSSTSTSSSTPTGSYSQPFTVLDHETEIPVSPSVRVKLPAQASENRRQAAPRQTIIDITGDASPKISLNPLSLGESPGQPSRGDCSRDQGILQSSWHHNAQAHSTGLVDCVPRTSDIIEVSAKVTANPISGLYGIKYIGALPFSHEPHVRAAKRLKRHREIAMSPIMDHEYSLSDSRRGISGELWPAESVPLAKRSASAKLKDQVLSSGLALKELEQKEPTQATRFSALTGKRSLGQRTLSKPNSTSTKPRQKQRYTFGDAFCGAGGTSRGAKSAGFRVEWGFDFDFAAIISYSLNFYNADCIVAWAHNFADISFGDAYKADILHLSPPCQVFSPAHTVNGKDDDMNTATFFALETVVRRIKPRVVTLENTSGLLILHPVWLNSAIHVFTKLGFSVRWKILNFAEYGLAQARKRLVIVASCPGEGLPVFPKPTHGTRFSGLAPFVTVQDVISRIPEGLADHDPDSARERNEPPYPADQPLRACITCNGGGNYHPSGKRSFTLREYACLQGFPLEHKFGPRGVKKQIGNAVPPSFAKILFEEIKQTLLEADGF